ncbi:MAG: response regulator, partial [bacterium]|nr:response regulator [bacterium]
VYGIIKQNGGNINIYSERGLGTTTKVYLPLYLGDMPEVEVVEIREDAGFGSETILLVEDEEAILEMTTRILTNKGYNVLAASLPKTAIELAKQNETEIHLLLSDVVMPGASGPELEAGLLSFLPDLKSVFMSGYTANVIAQDGILDEDMNFLQKPFSMVDLLTKVRLVLDED